jgi:hypothetical protein
MSAPIAMPMLQAEPMMLGAAPGGDPIDGTAFSMTLGAAMAVAVIVPPAPVPMPEPIALELFLDGEWVAEGALDSDAESLEAERTSDPDTRAAPEAASVAGHLAISTDAEPAMSLERGLALWAARVGRMPGDDVDGDSSAEVSSDRDEAGTALIGEAGDVAITKGPAAPVVGLPVPVDVAAPTPVGAGPVGSDEEVREPVELGSAESRSVQAGAGSSWRPIDDGGLVDETVPGSVLLERRAALIEIAGFAFPTDHAEEWATPPMATGRPALRSDLGERRAEASFEAALTTDQELEALARVTLDSFRASVRESRPADRLDRTGATLEGARVVEIARAEVVRTEMAQPEVRRLEGARTELTRLEVSRASDPAEGGPTQGEATRDGPSGNGQAGVGQDGGGREQWAAARTAHPVAATFDARVDSRASVDAPTPIAVSTPVVRRDQVTIQLTDEGGEVGRIRVAVNGPTVRATIIPHDPALADRLNGNLRELRRSLEERGFAEPRVTIQVPRTAEAAPSITTRELVFDVHGATEFRAPTRNAADDRWREPGGDDPRGGREQRQRSPDRSKDQHHDQRRSDQ